METALTVIGFCTCFFLLFIAVMKGIETVWFFQEFRKDITKKLEVIEKTLREQKP